MIRPLNSIIFYFFSYIHFLISHSGQWYIVYSYIVYRGSIRHSSWTGTIVYMQMIHIKLPNVQRDNSHSYTSFSFASYMLAPSSENFAKSI